MAQLFFVPIFQAVDANGAPYSGALLYFYQTGTTTLLTVYQDEDFDAEHENPVEADASGRFPAVYLAETEYKIVLKTSAGVTLSTVDPVLGALSANADQDTTRNHLQVGPYVVSRTVLKALDTTLDKAAYLMESAREGWWTWTAGNFAAAVTADSNEWNYVKADAIATSSGAWVRAIRLIDHVILGSVDPVTLTSIGIDDNATGERLDITDTTLSIGSTAGASDYIIARPVSSGSLTLNGNTGGTTGAGIRLGAQAHATLANTTQILAAGSEVSRFDASAFMVGCTGIISIAAATSGMSTEITGRIAQVVTNDSCLGQRRLGGAGGVIQTYVDGAGNACGNITTSAGATAFNTSSDMRLKTNLRPIKSGEIIDALEAWKFDWTFADKAGFGVMAQDADKVFHHAISINDDGLYGVDYSKFVPVLLAEMKALRSRVAELEVMLAEA